MLEIKGRCFPPVPISGKLGQGAIGVMQNSLAFCQEKKSFPVSLWVVCKSILDWVAMPFSRGSSQPRD